MGKFLPILSVLTFSLSSCEQSYREYALQDIGLQVKIPSEYVIRDSFPKMSFLDANGKEIIDTAKLQELKDDIMKSLLVVLSPDRNSTASFNIAMETAKTGDFDQYYNFSKDMQRLMAKQQMTDYDTTSFVLTVDNIKVHKVMTYSTKTNPVQYSGIYLTHVKKYFLVIKTDYADKKFGEEIEKAILTSKFN